MIRRTGEGGKSRGFAFDFKLIIRDDAQAFEGYQGYGIFFCIWRSRRDGPSKLDRI